MKKDCASVRKALPDYVRGHMFKYQQMRIARHLSGCPVCRSEFQALQHIADTRRLLEDVNASEGPLQRAARSFARLRILFYRPLWMLLIAGAAVFLYINLTGPRERDVEIENIEKTLPPAAPAVSAPADRPDAVAHPAEAPAPRSETPSTAEARRAPAEAVAPLIVVITPFNQETPGKVNEVLKEYSQFRGTTFTDSVSEIRGGLEQDRFLEFVDRIQQDGKVSYSHKKFSSFPAGQPIPFLLKMKPAPRQPERMPVAAESVESKATGSREVSPSTPAPPQQTAP